MKTIYFHYALEVAKTGSITKASENLFMAQPNLSKAIIELEDELGYSIFKRTAKGLFPTDEGAQFLEYARTVMIQIEKMQNLGKEDAVNMQSFNVSIPRGSYIAQGFTKFAAELDSSNGMNINMQETNSVKTISNVADGLFHLGIIRYQIVHEKYFADYLKSKQLHSEDLWEFQHLAIMSKEHSLANKEDLSYQDLSLYPEIVHGDNTVPYVRNLEEVSDTTTTTKKKIYVYERYNQFDLLQSIPSSFMWTSPIPENILKRYDLAQRKCVGEARIFKDVIIYPEGYKLGDFDLAFIKKVKEERDNVSSKIYK